MEDDVKDRLNKALQGRFDRTLKYTSVQVLVLYWEESDDPGFETEAKDVGYLFEREFFYVVEYYPIPKISSQLMLNRKITDFLIAHNDPDKLLIIHYGGHADEDRGGKDQYRRAVWASHGHNGASLKWFEIQPMLRQHPSEVLIFLDCCFGGQAGRPSESPVPPNCEILAACAMNLETARPGPASFTAALIKELKSILACKHGYLTVLQVFKNLVHRDAGLVQTPVHFGLEKNGSIRLAPYSKPSPTTHNITESESSSLTLQVSLRNPIVDERALTEITDWLRTNAPPTVSSLSVDKVRLSVSRIQRFIEKDFGDGRTTLQFDNLPKPTQIDIWTARNAFATQMARIASFLKSTANISSHLVSGINETTAAQCVDEVERSYLPLERTVERAIVSSPELSAKDKLLAAIDDRILDDLGFKEALKIRLINDYWDNEADDMSKEIKLPPPSSDIKTGLMSMESFPNLGNVIVESKRYTRENINKYMLEVSTRRMQQLAELLSTAKSAEFHTLKCLHWFHYPKDSRYGLVFEAPRGAKTMRLMSLRDIIQRAHKSRPSLGQRFEIAQKIGEAISKWHVSGWVHQGIASKNIWFFYEERNSSLKIDYSHPYLCGFAFARQKDSPSAWNHVEDVHDNVYRHPERQGMPSKSHKKVHDLYAYGILLLELGLWDIISKWLKGNDTNHAYNMQARILDISQQNLSHKMGAKYEKATSTCINGDFGVLQDDDVETNLAKAFEKRVLEPLRIGIYLDTMHFYP